MRQEFRASALDHELGAADRFMRADPVLAAAHDMGIAAVHSVLDALGEGVVDVSVTGAYSYEPGFGPESDEGSSDGAPSEAGGLDCLGEGEDGDAP